MANATPIEENLSKKIAKVAQDDPLKLLAAFFNGVVINLDEEYSYES